ncbi:von Willebrand factor A domain-containing protein 5A [Sparganum proliferum]
MRQAYPACPCTQTSRPVGIGGGLFDKNGTLPKDVPLKEISVHAEVQNLVADVTCKLVYKNDSKDLVETLFVFAIDSDADVYNFEAEIGQKRLVAKCRERLEAKQTYQEAVDSGHTAFYLEEDELMGDTFAMKVALQSDFKFDHDLEMEIVFADPNKLMIAYEEGDSKEKSGILSLDCLTVDFLPVFKEETDTRNEVIFLIDRSGKQTILSA